MVFTERAIETFCNGKNQPQLLARTAKAVHGKAEQIIKDKLESITSATKYETQWAVSAPDA